jgi:hypothetical protein
MGRFAMVARSGVDCMGCKWWVAACYSGKSMAACSSPGKRTHVTCGAQLSPVSALVLATLASDASAPITSRTHLPKKTEVITLEHLSA